MKSNKSPEASLQLLQLRRAASKFDRFRVQARVVKG
ncbi:MAG TPA: adenine phosphoribosyltransferase [Franconibacter helveticus]|nr:adenine phosphoribosyltransferase [Franconibacter helveticus]